jgi:hypothetical protein
VRRFGCMHDLLLAHSGHEEEFEPDQLLLIASSKVFVQLFPLIDLGALPR